MRLSKMQLEEQEVPNGFSDSSDNDSDFEEMKTIQTSELSLKKRNKISKKCGIKLYPRNVDFLYKARIAFTSSRYESALELMLNHMIQSSGATLTQESFL